MSPKLVRLNRFSFAQRRAPKPQPSGIGRRELLLGSAVGMVAASPAARAARQLASSAGYGLSLRKSSSGEVTAVTVQNGIGGEWKLDTKTFAGRPKLSVESTLEGDTIRLVGARFPGCKFAFNLTATIFQKGLSNRVRFDFEKAGISQSEKFSMEAALGPWLNGDVAAKSKNLSLTPLLKEGKFAGPIGLLCDGSGPAAYRSNGSLTFQGELQLTKEDQTYPASEIELLSRERGEDDLAKARKRISTSIGVVKGTDWNAPVSLLTQEGWHVKGDANAFKGLTVQAFEGGTGAVRFFGEDALVVNRADLTFDLTNHDLTQSYGSADETLFAANLAEGGVWLHQPGLSIQLGPQGGDFVIHTNRKGELSGEPALHALQVAPVVEDAVLSMPPHEPLPVTLEMSAAGVQSVGISVSLPFDIVRRVDMLNLTFIFYNYKLTASMSAPGVMTLDNPRLGGWVVVVFPPQALAEESLFEDTSDTKGAFSTSGPLYSRLANPTKLVFFIPNKFPTIQMTLNGPGGLLDWSNWDQYVAPTAISSFVPSIGVVLSPNNTGTIQIDSTKIPTAGLLIPATPDELRKSFGTTTPAPVTPTIAPIGTIRKVVGAVGGLLKPTVPVAATPTISVQELPKFTSFPALSRLPITFNPPPTPNPSLAVTSVPLARIPIPWYSMYTSIELPAWLTISPDENAGWAHSWKGETLSAGAAWKYGVLWHTRLAYKGSGVTREFTEDGKWTYAISAADQSVVGPTPNTKALHSHIRAIDSFDYDSGIEILPTIQPSGANQKQLPDLDHLTRKGLVDLMSARSATAGQDSNPFVVERLLLSALGGTLKGEWSLGKEPTNPGAGPPPGSTGLLAWRHVATLGRDHYVKVARRGFLYPTMHHAVLITITERKFQRGGANVNGQIFAILRTRQFIVISDPNVFIDAADQLNLGFQSIACLTKHTPDIDALAMSTSSAWLPFLGQGAATSPNGLWVLVGGKPFNFNMKAIDMDGNEFSWAQPSIFVQWEVGLETGGGFTAIDFAALATKFNTTNPPGNVLAKVVTGGQHVSFAPSNKNDKTTSTQHPCDRIYIGGTKSTTNIAQGIPGFRPILVEADVHIPAVEQLSGYQTSQTVQLAKAYTKNGGFGPNNAGEVFLELISPNTGGKPNGGDLNPVGTQIKDVSKSGGILSPNLNVGALSRLSGAVSWPPPSGSNQQLGSSTPPSIDTSQYFGNLNAKILGVVNLIDILPKQLKLGGDGKQTPKLTVAPVYPTGAAPLSVPPIGAQVNFVWSPSVSSFPTGDAPIFQASRKGLKSTFSINPSTTGTNTAGLLLTALFRTDFATPNAPDVSPYYLVDGKLTDVTINAINPVNAIVIGFQRLEFKMETGKPTQIYVDTDPIGFVGPLAFVQTLANFLGQTGNGLHMPGSGNNPTDENPDPNTMLTGRELASTRPYLLPDDDDGGVGFSPYFNISASGIVAGFTLKVPSISIGILGIRNISVSGELDLPFLIDPLRVKFSFCTRDNPFALSVWGITGGGFVGITLGLDGLEIFEGSLEFGASISIDLGLASGSVSLMAGIYFKITSGSTTLTGYVRLNGSLSVIEIITLSLTFYLSLTLYIANGSTSLTGTATLTVEVSILFFSASVSLSVSKTIGGAGPPSGSMLVPSNDDLYAMNQASGLPAIPPNAPQIPWSSVVTQPQTETYWAAFGGL